MTGNIDVVKNSLSVKECYSFLIIVEYVLRLELNVTHTRVLKKLFQVVCGER